LAAQRSSAMKRSRRSVRLGVATLAALIALLACAVSALAGPGVTGTNLVTTPDTTPEGYTQPSNYSAPANDGLGVPSGAIKHVWVIVMENHAYETNFTGLNDNSYLAKTLPQYGAELTHYYGTGHSSLDNYLTMTSGQAPMTDDQDDCPGYTQASGSVDTSGTLTSNGNYGQFASAAGPNAPAGDNGCVYPSTVPTLFNQLDAKGDSWKVYAQDLTASSAVGSGAVTGQNAGTQSCGAPDAIAGPTPSASQSTAPGATGSPYYVKGGAVASDQYVAKHNPLPWFDSIVGTPGASDCNASHLANLFTANGTSDQLYGDLQSESTTPDLSYIVPDNCSNGHDAVCAGNNLSGMATGATTNAAEGTPINYVGGAYSSDLFLEHVIPEIMSSPAYSDGGLIAVVWDEAYPQFTYSGDSLADSAVSTASAYNSLQNDSAGETLFGRSLNWEPSGPNVPNVESQVGQQLAGGPGYNEYLDRPGSSAASPLVGCTAGVAAAPGYDTVTANGCYSAGGTSESDAGDPDYGSDTSITGSASTSGLVTQSGLTAPNLVTPNDEGEQITLPTGVTGSDVDSLSTYYVGQVSSSVPADVSSSTPDTSTAVNENPSASFQIVDADGNPVTLSSAVAGGTFGLGGETPANDPLYDAFDPTTGGGDSGAILLSPYIKGGTVSNTYYNHYSLLRSLEDIYQVSSATGSSAPYTGSISLSGGLDSEGHLGYAAQPGLDPLGTDVFTDSPYVLPTTVTNTTTVYKPGSIFTVTTHRTTKVFAVDVPKLTGRTLAAARLILGYAGLRLGKVKEPKAKRGYERIVATQSLRAGKQTTRNTKVNLTVKLRKGE
jgi:hypothetical protein